VAFNVRYSDIIVAVWSRPLRSISDRVSGRQRSALWSEAAEFIEERPLVEYGSGTYDAAETT